MFKSKAVFPVDWNAFLVVYAPKGVTFFVFDLYSDMVKTLVMLS